MEGYAIIKPSSLIAMRITVKVATLKHKEPNGFNFYSNWGNSQGSMENRTKGRYIYMYTHTHIHPIIYIHTCPYIPIHSYIYFETMQTIWMSHRM